MAEKKQWPSLSQRVETMASVTELLLETLAGLSDGELEKFKEVLSKSYYLRYSHCPIPWMLLLMRDKQDLVFLMVETYSQQSVERTQEVLKEMNRTDLVQRLSESHSGPKKKPSVDEHLSALIHKVATMMAVKELLLETLKDLNSEEMKNFKLLLQFMFFQKGLPLISWTRMLKTSWPETLVSMMVEICGQQSVEVTREVFMDMNRTDLVQRLSETSSRPKEKHSVDEHCPALIQKVEMMASVTELLLETLAGLSNSELNSISISQSPPSFKHVLLSHSDFYRYVSDIPWIWLKMYDMQDLVFLLVLTYGQQSVEETKDVLKRMNKTDLVQRLSDSSSGHKKKHFADKHRSALIQKVATMAAVKQLLLETLNDLSNEGLEKFKEYLQLTFHQRDLPDVSSMLLHRTDKVKIVDLMVQTCGQRSVEVTREVFMDMKRTDLVHRLSKPSSGLKEKHSVDEHRPTLSEKAAAMAAVKQILLETLKDLSLNELEKFKWLLHFTYFQKSLPQISWSKLDWVDSVDLLVDMMVKNRQSVEVTKEVLMDMNRTDLVKRLSETSSGLKEKHEFKAFQKEVPMTSLKEKLFKTLQDLSHRELQKFKQLLQQTEMKKGPRHRMETAGSVDIATLMMEIYGRQSVEVTSKVLKKMNRTDLVQRLSDSSSGSKEGRSRSFHPVAYGSIMDSSAWTALEPEVAPSYSLQSEAGNFECSVSGLRWVCKEQVSFKFQFCSWGNHMERMEKIEEYMPAGPLMDISMIAGKFSEVYLPHWICIDDNPKILDKFAVLHIDDYGDVVEKVAEVTPSHVKLSEPAFSPRAVLMKVGFPVKIRCKVLIYKTNTAFLTLHVYLIPCDPGLRQEMDKQELSYGYNIIRKPHPERSLKMQDCFILTADLDGAEINPQKLKLRYESKDPNFFEVFIENPDRNFTLKLAQENEHEQVWTCVIRKDECQSTGHIQGQHFVDKHRHDLIERVSNIEPILDNLLRDGVIQQEDYDTIAAIRTTQDKVRKLFIGPLRAGGHACKDLFYKILEEKEPFLVTDLKRKES